MITNDGYKRLFHFLLWVILGFIIAIVGISNVFAYDTSQYYVAGDVSNKLQQLVSTNYGSSPFTNPINSGYAFGEVLEVSNIVSNYSFQANKVYQLEVHLGHQKFTNSNVYNVVGLNGEICLISYENSIMNNDAYPRWAFQCPHSTSTITITIGNSSGSYLWSGTNVFDWVSATLWASDTLSFENSDIDNIINNQNQNTQNIINNQNQNTQDIIDNQNAIANQQEKQQEVCNTIDKGSIIQQNKKLNSTGAIETSNAYGLTDYVRLGKSLTRVYGAGGTSAYFCWYDSAKTLLSCQTLSSFNSSVVTIPTDAVYFRTSIEKSANRPIFKVCYDGNQATSNAINDLDGTLKNDNVDENDVADAFESFNDYLDDNSTITQLITLPITLYTAILNNLNGTCSPFNLGKLYGEDLIIPCINISQYLGNSLWTMIDIIISGFAVYAISKKMIKVFNNFSSLREGDVIDD